MSATASPSFPTRDADIEYARRVKATLRGIGLVGVLKGFARSVMGLGVAMSDIVARLKTEGADPYSANSGFDLPGVMRLLRMALNMTDALRARLRTPAVIALMKRPRPSRAGIASKPKSGTRYAPGETMAELLYLRRDRVFRQAWRQTIASMSDRDVLAHIYAALQRASAMLGETALVARVERLGCAASALLADGAEDVAPDPVAKRPAASPKADDGPEPSGVPGVAAVPHTGGRGPP